MDSEKILLSAFRKAGLKKILGVPTLVMRPEEFDGLTKPQVGKKLEEILSDFLCASERYDGETRRILLESFYVNFEEETDYLFNTLINGGEAFASSLHLKKPKKRYAHEDPTRAYQTPVGNIICTSSHTHTGVQFAKGMLGWPSGLIEDLPGDPFQWQFLDFWHEAGHGLGAAEPQTETIGSIIFKRKFRNDALLTARSDIRAATTLIQHNSLFGENILKPIMSANPMRLYQSLKNNAFSSKQYGWQMVDALDAVIEMPLATIDEISDEELIDIRYKKFDPKTSSVNTVVRTLSMNAPHSYYKRDLPALQSELNELITRGNFGDERQNAYKVAMRLDLALRRLIGQTPYDPEPSIDPGMEPT